MALYVGRETRNRHPSAVKGLSNPLEVPNAVSEAEEAGMCILMCVRTTVLV